MDSTHRFWSMFWITASVFLLGCLFMITDCTKKSNVLNNQAQIACINKGGTYGRTPGRAVAEGSYTCTN